jgi:hypothetical protein
VPAFVGCSHGMVAVASNFYSIEATLFTAATGIAAVAVIFFGSGFAWTGLIAIFVLLLFIIVPLF